MKPVSSAHVLLTGAVLALGVAVLQPNVLGDAAADLYTFSLTPDSPVSVLFVGDIMLDRSVAFQARDYGRNSLFKGVADLFQSADILVGNLEGPLTDNPSIAQVDREILRFTFDPSFAAYLKDLGFDAVSLANNHALDFGVDGYEQTLGHLKDSGIVSFGYPFNSKNVSAVMPMQGKTLCLVGYHSLFDPDTVLVVVEIKKIRPACTYVVVMPHWGEEYQHTPTAWQKAAAHEFIDAGADVVIGGHPHIVQPIEIYNGRAIFYSLGNFLFDQGFQPEVKRGVAVRVEFTTSSTLFTLTPVNTFKEVALSDHTTAQAVLRDLITDEIPIAVAISILNTASFELPK